MRSEPGLLVLCALAAVVGPLLDVASWAVPAAAIAIALIGFRKSPLLAFVLFIAIASQGWWRTRAAVERAASQRALAATHLSPPRRCHVVGPIEASPVLRDGRTVAVVLVEQGSCEGRRLPEGQLRVRLYGDFAHHGRGDRVEVIAQLGIVRAWDNPASNTRRYWRVRAGVQASGAALDVQRIERGSGLGRMIDAARDHVRDRIQATYAPSTEAMGRALVLGENDLSDGEITAFRESGLAHLLAVSGTHLVLSVLFLARCLSALLVRIGPLAQRYAVSRFSSAFAIPLCWLYADFAGGGGSAYRAAAMLSLGLLTHACGRQPRPDRCFFLSVLGFALVDPLSVYDLSFLLSVAATAGLLWALPPIDAWLTPLEGPHPGWLRFGTTLITATLAATIACSPVLLAVGGAVPTGGVFANVIAAPIGEIIALPVCLVHAIAWLFPAVEQGLAVIGSGALSAVRSIAAFAATETPAAKLPHPLPFQLAFMLSAAALALRHRRLWWLVLGLGIAGYGLTEVVAQRAGRPADLLRVTFIDVGQGDASLVDLPDGRSMLIDTGGLVGSQTDVGEMVLVPLLEHRRRERIDIVVITHPHPDHYGGLAAVMDRFEIGELWHNGQALGRGTAADLLAEAEQRGIRLVAPDALCNDPRAAGRATIEVLWPCPAPHPDASANDNSLVLRIAYGDRSVLFAGDAELAAEEALSAGSRTLRSDVLKVGHHGSRTSSSAAFLSRVRPSWAFASAGARNRFGHPHGEVRARFRAFRIPLWSTGERGSAVWHTDGEAMWVRPGR